MIFKQTQFISHDTDDDFTLIIDTLDTDYVGLQC